MFDQLKLKNKDFSIICNNCVAWGIYHKLKMEYTTPTIGLFFMAEDYIRFLENFSHYIHQPLIFLKETAHPEVKEWRRGYQWPIGTLGDGIELHFSHYPSERDALQSWNRRVLRINFENLFFIYSEKYSFKEEFFERYMKLPFNHKLFFSAKQRTEEDVVYIKEYTADGFIGDSWIKHRYYEKHMNVVKWLNGEKKYIKSQNKLK